MTFRKKRQKTAEILSSRKKEAGWDKSLQFWKGYILIFSKQARQASHVTFSFSLPPGPFLAN